jgi:class 3 adenylate cyclase
VHAAAVLLTKNSWILLLVLALALTLLALLVAVTQLVRLRRENEELRRSPAADSAVPRAVQAAGWAMKTALGTAERVRERGFVGGMLMAPIEELTGIALQDQDEIVAVAAPDGTVTFLFSDIEDSTTLNDSLGDEAWVRVLRAHDRIVRSAVARYDGHVVKSQGDGFMVVFSTPEAAVRAAGRIQRGVDSGGRRLRRTPIKVRIGIHCGTAVARDGDYFGRNVAKAARIAALAEGGQILLSDEVRQGLDESGHALEELAAAELKGLSGTHLLWAVNGRR